MKLFLLLLSISLQVSAIANAQQVSLNVKNAKISTVLDAIYKQTGYSYGFTKTANLKDAKPVSLSLKAASIESTLQTLFSDQPFDYQIDNALKMIVIQPKNVKKQSLPEITSDNYNPASQTALIGFVRDQSGNPLPGVSVLLKGTEIGSVTDASGRFVIANAPSSGSIILRMIGRETKELRYVNSRISDITLAELSSDLSEVQIVAYGEVSKKFITSNVGNISGQQIAMQPVTNPLLALQGRIPGLYIQQTSGQTMGNVNTVIQGPNSLRQGTEPFIVVDGIPFPPQLGSRSLAGGNIITNSSGAAGSALNFINPNDIESVTILKDADATAIYGSRAANGAILITTRKGKSGHTRVDLNLQNGWGKLTRKADLLSTAEYLEMRREAYRNAGQAVPTSATPPNATNFDLTIWDPNKNHDWQEELVGGTAGFSNLQASVSGGSDKTQFLVGATYNRQTTVYPNDLSDERYNVHFNLTHASENKKFKFNLSGSYLTDKNTQNSADLMGAAVTLAPNAPDLYKSDGSINWSPYPNNPNLYSFRNNPIANTAVNRFVGNTDNLLANGLLSYEILQGLEIKSTFGYNSLIGNEMLLFPLEGISPDVVNKQARSQFMDKSVKSYIIEPQINYNRSTNFGNVEFLLGTTFQESKSSTSGINASGFSNNSQLSNISAATTLTSAGIDNQALYRYSAIFGRFNYRYNDKYILNLTARRDGSSRFGENNKFHNFYSVGGAWLFGDENAVKKVVPLLSSGKLRVNYGTTGNDQIGDYNYESLLQNLVLGMPYQDVGSALPTRHDNPDLQWEETKKLNIGIDLGFFNERINLSSNYFLNRSSNQLIAYTLPGITGFSFVTANFPATVQNAGFEFLIDVNPIKNNDFRWDFSFNATIPRNKLAKFQNLENSTYASEYVIDLPINIRQVYEFAGVDPELGTYQFKKADGTLTGAPSAVTDRTRIFDPNPKWYGGFSNTIRYKNLSFDFLLQYVDKDAQNDRFRNAGTLNNNITRHIFDRRWRQKGDVTDVQKFSSGLLLPQFSAAASDAQFSDASFLRLKNASVSYNLPSALLRKVSVANARIYIQGQNLFTITNYQGTDPETAVFNRLPPLRLYTIGLQVTF